MDQNGIYGSSPGSSARQDKQSSSQAARRLLKRIQYDESLDAKEWMVSTGEGGAERGGQIIIISSCAFTSTLAHSYVVTGMSLQAATLMLWTSGGTRRERRAHFVAREPAGRGAGQPRALRGLWCSCRLLCATPAEAQPPACYAMLRGKDAAGFSTHAPRPAPADLDLAGVLPIPRPHHARNHHHPTRSACWRRVSRRSGAAVLRPGACVCTAA